MGDTKHIIKCSTGSNKTVQNTGTFLGPMRKTAYKYEYIYNI